MLDCLILGDSIAVGVGQARPQCETAARVGIGSGAFVQTLFAAAPKAAGHVVISLGVNDGPTANTLEHLRSMRRQLHATDVTWLLPGLKEEIRSAIRTVAAENADRLVDTRTQVGPDHLHPTASGYRLIAAWTQGAESHDSPPQRTASMAPAHSPVVFQPTLGPSNPPQFLPMVQVPTVRPSFQPGFPFRMWVPTGLTYAAAVPRTFAFRMFPAAVSR